MAQRQVATNCLRFWMDPGQVLPGPVTGGTSGVSVASQPMSPTRSPRAPRFPRTVAVLLLAAAVWLFAAPGIAGALAGTPVSPDLNTTGGLVTGGGQPDRVLTSDQAAAFSQSWLSVAMYGTPVLEDPPAGTPTFRVTTTYITADQTGENVVNLATDGTGVWLSLPAQVIYLGITVTEDQADKWFLGNPIVLQAFNGELAPQPVGNPLSSSTTAAAEPASSSSDSSPVLLIVVIVVAAAVIIAAVIIGSRRRGTNA